MFISPTLDIPDRELSESFVRASGAGGQNVNKVSTAVELRFSIWENQSLPYDVRARLVALGGSRVTDEGVLILFCQVHRTQDQNRKAVRERLSALILKAAKPPPPPRRPTKPTLGAVKRRLVAKSVRASHKQGRQKITDLEEE